jgi:hypothetical protein
MNASTCSFAPSLRSFLTAVCLYAVVTMAQAQWGWKGADGRMVFSDQPPPQGIAEKDITRRPGGGRTAVSAGAAATNPAATLTSNSGTNTTATAPKLSSKDPELEKRKKEAQAKEAATQKAEEEKVTSAKRDNCERAKRAKASFDSGSRLSTVNAKGERDIMGDAQRAEETKRLQDIISSDCS